jgi:hypothetical protein
LRLVFCLIFQIEGNGGHHNDNSNFNSMNIDRRNTNNMIRDNNHNHNFDNCNELYGNGEDNSENSFYSTKSDKEQGIYEVGM